MQIKLLINSVDRTSLLVEDSYSIDDSDGPAIDVLELELDDQSSVITVAEGVDIVVEKSTDATVRYFGGIVAEVVYRQYGLGRIIKVTAQDWKVLLEKNTVTYEKTTSTADNTLISDIFTTAGLTEINVVDRVSNIRSIDKIAFNGQTLFQVMETLVEITGGAWDVDKFKKLIYEVPGTRAADFQFRDVPNDTTQIGFYDASRVKEMGQYNYVEVRGGKKYSADLVETKSGDGTTVTFYLGQINRAPILDFAGAANTENRIKVQKNTGTDGSPIWTDQTVANEFSETATAQVTWNPITRKVTFSSAPANLTSSFRVRGRYYTPIAAVQQDDAAIAAQGRTYKKVIDVPEVESDDQAIDLANAFLREQGPKDRILLSFDSVDTLDVGMLVGVVSTRLGLSTLKQYRVNQVTTRLLGATVGGYSVVLEDPVHGTGRHTFAHLLYEIVQKTRRALAPTRSEESVFQIRRANKRLGLLQSVATVTNPPYSGPYYARAPIVNSATKTGESWYPLDDWTHGIRDNTADRHGALTGQSVDQASGPAPRTLCLHFNGSTNYVALTDFPDLAAAADPLGILLYFKTSAAAQQVLLSKRNAGAGWTIFLDSSGRIHFLCDDGAGGVLEVRSSTSYNDNAWYLLGLSKAGATAASVTIRVVSLTDGNITPLTLVTVTDTLAGAVSNALVTTIGANPDATEKFSGYLRKLLLCTATLTLYNANPTIPTDMSLFNIAQYDDEIVAGEFKAS